MGAGPSNTGVGCCFRNREKPGPSLTEGTRPQFIIPLIPRPPHQSSFLFLALNPSAGFCPEQRDLLPMTQGLSHS